jgi:Tfp pilus assembly PilM family ATPase
MQFARHTAIGIDIGSRTVKAAQLSTRGGNLRIVALSMCPRIKPGGPIDREEITNTQGVLRRQGFTGSRIVLAVPDEQLLRGILQLPPSVPGPAVAQMARMELARIHHIEPQGFELVCWGQPSSEPARSNVQTVAVACPHPVAHRRWMSSTRRGWTSSRWMRGPPPQPGPVGRWPRRHRRSPLSWTWAGARPNSC